ncbi:hypothetical protein Bhyg_08297, partial [Pseudolycoriella hygida]
MDNYDAMASAVDEVLLESKFDRRQKKRRNLDKKKAEIESGRDGRISRLSKPYPKITEHQRFLRVNGANGNKVDGDARKIKEHLNVSGARQENDYGQNKGIRKFSQRFQAAGSPMSDTLPLLERMVTDTNVLTTSPTPNAMAPPNVSFSESQKTPRNQ